METEELSASSDDDRATHEPSLSAQSRPTVGIPCAGEWIVFRDKSSWDWGRFGSAKVEKITAKQVRVTNNSLWGQTIPRDRIVAVFDDGEAAKLLVQALAGPVGECNERRKRADKDRHERVAAARLAAEKAIERLIAQAIEARSATTTKIGVVEDESAVAESHAPGK